MTRTETLTAAQLIAPYEGPQWLVEPMGAPADADEVEEIDALNFEVLEANILGWGDYNAIIRVDRDELADYLARLA